jgi:microcystin-dependent protein
VADQFLGEIRAFGFAFAPTGWAACNGQVLSIAQNTALFSLLGTQYGGNGQTNFALPNLQGQVAIHAGQSPGLSSYVNGESGGSDSVTLVTTQLPAHSHSAVAVGGQGTVASPADATWAEAWIGRGQVPSYSAQTAGPTQLSGSSLGDSGGGGAHENRPPLLVVTFCIAMQGIFPART